MARAVAMSLYTSCNLLNVIVKTGKSVYALRFFLLSANSVTSVNLSQYVRFSARDGISKAWVLPASSNLTEKNKSCF